MSNSSTNYLRLDGKLITEPELRTFGDGQKVFTARLMFQHSASRGGVGFIDIADFVNPEATYATFQRNDTVEFVGALRFREWDARGGKRSALSAVGILTAAETTNEPQPEPEAEPPAAEPPAARRSRSRAKAAA
ncbi:MAG: Single-strand binding protein family [Conexibacter sp.]|nr:Single-strand binding protein family [Conexibacter sp.]